LRCERRTINKKVAKKKGSPTIRGSWSHRNGGHRHKRGGANKREGRQSGIGVAEKSKSGEKAKPPYWILRMDRLRFSIAIYVRRLQEEAEGRRSS